MLKLFTGALFIPLLLLSCHHKHQRSTAYSYTRPKQLNDGIATGTLTEAGIDTAKIRHITQLILADSIPNIHSLLIEKDGKLVYEQYFAGKDELWGDKLGYIGHSDTSLHDIRSISKSVVSACIGIALQQHLIKSIDEPVPSFFPEYARYNTGAKKNVTIRHLLTMSSGLKWSEGENGSENCEAAMERSSDPVPYILSRPVAAIPGTTWNYNSGGTQLLATIIKKVSGEDISAFATKNLFSPLNIFHHQWVKMDGGDPAAASGLRLTSRDLLKFANLYTNHGMANNKQVLTGPWIDSSFNMAITRPIDEGPGGYGYQFWIDRINAGDGFSKVPAAKGNGGQRIFFFNRYHAVIIITAGNYGKSIKNDSQALFRDYIAQAFGKP